MQDLRKLYIKATSGTFGLKIIHTGLGLTVNLLLARLLTLNNFGLYIYFMSWINLLTIPSVMGFDRLLIRNIPAYRSLPDWGLIRGLINFTNQSVLFISLCTGTIFFFTFRTMVYNQENSINYIAWFAFLLIPIASLARLRQAAMQGLHYILTSQIPELLIRPVLFIILIYSFHLIFGKNIDAFHVLFLNTFSLIIAFIIGTVLLYKILPKEINNTKPSSDTRNWLTAALPFVLISCMYEINARTDIIMLGTINGTESAGIYSIVLKGASFISLIAIAANTVLGPSISSLYHRGDIQRLKREASFSARAIFITSLLFSCALFFFGRSFLELFGSDFTAGYAALIILCAGKAASAAAGPVGLILTMTGHEREAASGIAAGALSNIVLNFLLIPRWGMEGAAAATAVSTVIWNLVHTRYVNQKLKIRTDILSRES